MTISPEVFSLNLNLKQPNEQERKLVNTRRDIPWSIRARVVNTFRRNLRCSGGVARVAHPASTHSRRRDREVLRKKQAAASARFRRTSVRPIAGPGSRHNWYTVNVVRLGHTVCLSTGRERPSKRRVTLWVQKHVRKHLKGTCNQWSEQHG